MKTNIMMWLLLVALLAGCAEEEALVPSGADRNWFVITEKPGALNQLIYEVYQSTGMPIFINDTLGMEKQGVDAAGKPVIYYEWMALGYTVEADFVNVKIVLSSDTAAMEETVRLLRDLVIPRLPKESSRRPHSFLIGDTLYYSDYGYNKLKPEQPGAPAYVYKDLTGIAIGRVCDILQMNELQKKFLAGMILAVNAGNRVYADFPDEIDDFYKVSLYSGTVTYHGKSATYDTLRNVKSTNPNYDWEPGEKGFLEYTVDGLEVTIPGRLDKRYPSKELDAQYYLAAVYAWTEEEFASLHGAWPKCMEKFRMMKEIVEAYEAKGKN